MTLFESSWHQSGPGHPRAAQSGPGRARPGRRAAPGSPVTVNRDADRTGVRGHSTVGVRPFCSLGLGFKPSQYDGPPVTNHTSR
eukprot:765148-Hanusia_phi.AAC.8